MMNFLIYLSHTPVLLTNQQLSEILAKSRIKNVNSEITGLLLYNDGNIIQVLEGEKQPLRDIYDVICKDKRHSGVSLMIEGECDKRNFPDWSMGFKNVSNEDWVPFAGYFNLRKDDLLTKLNTENQLILTFINSYMSVNIRS